MRLRLVLEAARMVVWEWDPIADVVTTSANLRDIYGVESITAVDRGMELVHPEDRERHRTTVMGAARDGTGYVSAFRIVRPETGETVWLEERGFPLTGPDGQLVKLVGVVSDVTARMETELERLRAYEAAEQARAEAEEANRVKGEFLAVMSHELRTPLNAIGGYAELLELGIRGPVTPAQMEDLQRIQQSQRRLLALINDVLVYARIERGAITYDIRPTLVADVIAVVTVLIEPQRAAKGVSLVVHLPENAGRNPHYVLADPERLQQILLNLLSNAVKFTPSSGVITVHLEAEPDDRGRAVIRVSDTGPGIRADRLGAIFEPFVQIGRGLSSPREGSGLGLSISHNLARGMGGTLTAESTVGVGSTFTLALPSAGHSPPLPDPHPGDIERTA